MERTTKGFIIVTVSCNVSIVLTGFFAGRLPMRFGFCCIIVYFYLHDNISLNRANMLEMESESPKVAAAKVASPIGGGDYSRYYCFLTVFMKGFAV